MDESERTTRTSRCEHTTEGEQPLARIYRSKRQTSPPFNHSSNVLLTTSRRSAHRTFFNEPVRYKSGKKSKISKTSNNSLLRISLITPPLLPSPPTLPTPSRPFPFFFVLSHRRQQKKENKNEHEHAIENCEKRRKRSKTNSLVAGGCHSAPVVPTRAYQVYIVVPLLRTSIPTHVHKYARPQGACSCSTLALQIVKTQGTIAYLSDRGAQGGKRGHRSDDPRQGAEREAFGSLCGAARFSSGRGGNRLRDDGGRGRGGDRGRRNWEKCVYGFVT